MQKKRRILYGGLFLAVFITEILIGLFVNDAFVRPYVGDMLVTVLICCFCRVLFPTGVAALPVYVFLFAAAVEIGQYFDVVKLLGLADNMLLSTVLGRTFSVLDLICYGIGCLAFWGMERYWNKA